MASEATSQEKLVNEEYKVWKKNSPFLYDLVLSSALEWPSLTCEWLPDKHEEKEQDDNIEFSRQRLLLGTHTSDQETNHVMWAEVRLPTTDSKVLADKYEESCDVYGGFGGAAGKIEVTQRIIHDGEVNRARHMPKNCDLVATKCKTGEVHLFDRTKHPSKPAKGGHAAPDMRFTGHTQEGFALAWSPHEEGLLISGAADKVVHMWRVSKNDPSQSVKPLTTFRGHQGSVEDVAWHRVHPNIFASVSDDRSLCIWDYKTAANAQQVVPDAHKSDVSCVSFSPFSEHLLVTGGHDKLIGLWDMRNLAQKLHSLEGHAGAVLQVAWCPQSEVHLASGATDRRVNIWDLSQIGMEQAPEDAEDGPPELLFAHGGHTDRISDFSWNPNDPWVIASVADNNIVQVWQMTDELLGDDDMTENAQLE